MTVVLTMPAGVERRSLQTTRGPVVASYAAPRPEKDLGMAVLLVTGYVGSKEDFWPLLPGIAEAGYHAWAYDQIGQYQSEGPLDPEAYTVELLAEDTRAIMAQIRAEQAPPVHLVGHCLGGFVARAATLSDPAAVRSLAFLGCGPSLNEPKQAAGLAELDRKLETGSLELFWPIIRRVVPERDAELRKFWFEKLATANPGFMHGTARAMATEPDRCGPLLATGVPTLVVQGKRDRRVWPKATFVSMAARLQAKHVVIDKAAHSPSFEQPEATLDALLQFWRTTAAHTEVLHTGTSHTTGTRT